MTHTYHHFHSLSSFVSRDSRAVENVISFGLKTNPAKDGQPIFFPNNRAKSGSSASTNKTDTMAQGKTQKWLELSLCIPSNYDSASKINLLIIICTAGPDAVSVLPTRERRWCFLPRWSRPGCGYRSWIVFPRERLSTWTATYSVLLATCQVTAQGRLGWWLPTIQNGE